MNIYICSKKIVDKKYLDYFVICNPISVMSQLRKFLVFSKDFECADARGSINMKLNSASNHFIIFGADLKKFNTMVDLFSSKNKADYFNNTDKDEIRQRESIFYTKNKKLKDYLDSLKDDYDIHKANKNIFKMAECLKQAEAIVSGKIRIQ